MARTARPAAPPAAPPPEAPAPVAGPEGHALLDDIQRDKLSLIGHMASSIAHELSNPLATIVASTQAILAFWPRPGQPGAPQSQSRDPWSAPSEFAGYGVPLRQLREDLELVLTEARRAGDIVHGLLASARCHPPEWRICSLADVVRRTVALSRHHLKLHNIALQSPYFDQQEGYPLWSRIRGDGNQLQQVLLNLLINAQQAITAERGYGAVRVTLGPDGPDRVVLVVEDDGPGIPEALRDSIFHPYFTTKPSGQGTGLGLSISAEIVKAHGGSITVDNHERGGARFRLVLPSLAAADRQRGEGPALTVSATEPIPLPVNPSGPMRRVLLVDDESGIRKSVGKFLRRYGFQVTDVGEVESALTALRQQSYDAIVSDLRMPGISGEAFFDLVCREFPAMVNRIVFTSGDTLREESQRFLERSGCPSLQKPYELAELVRLLEDLPSAASPAPRRATA